MCGEFWKKHLKLTYHKRYDDMSNIDLYKIYSEISKYDVHYSTVRAAVTTYLVSIGLYIGYELVITNGKPGYIIAVFFFLVIAYLVNKHFQNLSYICQNLQKSIESKKFTNSSCSNFKFRNALKSKMESYNPCEKLKPRDIFDFFLLCGGLAYVALLIGLYFTGVTGPA